MPALSCARRSLGPVLSAPRGGLAVALAIGLLAAPASGVDLILSGMTYVGSDSGRPELMLEAEQARIPHGSDRARLEGVRVDATGDDGRSSLLMTCDRAELDLATNDFTATGNVRGQTGDGHRFRADVAVFEHATGVIEGHSNVDIVDPSGTHLQGDGFRYEVRAQRMRMRNAVVTDVVEEP